MMRVACLLLLCFSNEERLHLPEPPLRHLFGYVWVLCFVFGNESEVYLVVRAHSVPSGQFKQNQETWRL